MNAEMRAALTYRGQRKPGLFLSKTDAEKKEFLTKLLGLDKFERAQEVGAANVKMLEADVAILEASHSDLLMRLTQLGPTEDSVMVQSEYKRVKNAIASENARIDSMNAEIGKMREEADAAAVDASSKFQGQLRDVNKIYSDLLATVIPDVPTTPEMERASKLVQECQRRHERLEEEDSARRADLAKRVQHLNSEINRLTLKAGTANRYLAKKDEILADLKAMETDVCPTCQREWDQAEQKRAQLRSDMEGLDVKLAECLAMLEEMERIKLELATIPPFEPNPKVAQMLVTWRAASDQLSKETEKASGARALQVSKRYQAIAEVKAELLRLREEAQFRADEARKKALAGVDGLVTLIADARHNIADAQSVVDTLKFTLGRITEREKQAVSIRTQLMDAKGALAPKTAELAAERDFLHLVGREGFLGSIFDEVLAEISDETNQVLASIANTRRCTLHFTSENLTKKGTVNREIVPVVTINGHKASLKFGPSGGMLSAIELAVDFALAAVISRRTGVVPGWLILDESFDGLGPVEKETCFEVLQKYGQDRLVIVVDHMSETQGLFTRRVTVEYVDGRSRIC